MKAWILLAAALACLGVGAGFLVHFQPAARSEPHRSPLDLVLLTNGRALTANSTADSISLLDLKTGKLLAEQAVGRKPSAVACTRDGRLAAVGNLWSGTVTLLSVGADTLTVAGEIKVGPLP